MKKLLSLGFAFVLISPAVRAGLVPFIFNGEDVKISDTVASSIVAIQMPNFKD